MNLKRWFRFLTYEHQSEHAYTMPDGTVHVHPALYEKILSASGPPRVHLGEGEITTVEGGATIVRNPYCPLGPVERRWIWQRPAKSPLAKVKSTRGTG